VMQVRLDEYFRKDCNPEIEHQPKIKVKYTHPQRKSRKIEIKPEPIY